MGLLNKFLREDRNFIDSAIMNSYTYRQYYYKLLQIAFTRFKYEGLPDSVDPVFLERELTLNGHLLYFNDDVLGDLVLNCTFGGGFNVYNEPLIRRAYTNGSYKNERDASNSIIIRDNMMPLYMPFNIIDDLQIFAMRLWHCDQIADINVEAQKTPILIRCKENMKNTLKNVYMKYRGNQPVIFAYRNLVDDDFSVLKTDAPFNADKILDIKERIWNDALTFLGVSNVRYEKKERQISDEIIQSMGGTLACRASRMEARQYSIDRINKMFGHNISVHYNDGIVDSDMPVNGGDDSGGIYDDTEKYV